jgi:hypothetical protein
MAGLVHLAVPVAEMLPFAGWSPPPATAPFRTVKDHVALFTMQFSLELLIVQLPSNGFSLAWARWAATGEATAQAKATTPRAAAGNRRHQMFDMSYLLR